MPSPPTGARSTPCPARAPRPPPPSRPTPMASARTGRAGALRGRRPQLLRRHRRGRRRVARGSRPEPVIYVLSGLMPGDAGLCRAADLVPCLNSPEQVAAHRSLLPGHPCALQIDTGMNRLGIEPGDLGRIAPERAALRPVLALSHLACADEPGHPMNAAQREAFRAACAHLPPMRRSLAATGGILLGPDYHFDLTRPGVGLYGGLPFAPARPVVTLSLPVVQVRDLAARRGRRLRRGLDRLRTRPDRHGRRRLRRRAETRARPRRSPALCRATRLPRRRPHLDGPDHRRRHAPCRVPDRLDILNASQTVDDLARLPEPSATRS
jgi:hypothetical protein